MTEKPYCVKMWGGSSLVYGGVGKEEVRGGSGDCNFQGKCSNDAVGEVVTQECLRANSIRIDVGYSTGRVVTPHFGRQLRLGPTVTLGSCGIYLGIVTKRGFTHCPQLCVDQSYPLGNQSSRFTRTLAPIRFLWASDVRCQRSLRQKAELGAAETGFDLPEGDCGSPGGAQRL